MSRRPATRRVVLIDLAAGAVIAGIALAIGPGLAILGIVALAILLICLLASAPAMARRRKGRRRARERR